MSTPLFLASLWVIAGAITAFLPMRRQMVPGVVLLTSAPLLLIWIGAVHGWVWALLGLLAFLSMFRNPLIYLCKRARGIEVELPKEFRK